MGETAETVDLKSQQPAPPLPLPLQLSATAPPGWSLPWDPTAIPSSRARRQVGGDLCSWGPGMGSCVGIAPALHLPCPSLRRRSAPRRCPTMLQVTGFSNAEEVAVGKDKVVPFSLEDRMKELGGSYSCGPDWAPYALASGKLITGQNPSSSKRVAEVRTATALHRPTAQPRLCAAWLAAPLSNCCCNSPATINDCPCSW